MSRKEPLESSEIDISESVQNALRGFPAGNEDKDSLSSEEIENFIDTLAEPKEIIQFYKKEMEQLQKEIEALEENVEADQQKLLQIPNSVLEEIKSKVDAREGDKDTNEQLEAIVKQLQLQASFSKIHSTDVTIKVTKQTTSKTVTSHHIQGHSHGLEFSVNFQVTDTKIPEGETIPQILAEQKSKSVITRMTTTVDDKLNAELNEIVKEIDESCALEPFLNGYAQYTEWFRHREKTFTHFKNHYPEAVTLPQGNTGPLMQISHPKFHGAVCLVSWTIPFCLHEREEPCIELHVKASSHMSQVDVNNTLESVPEEFSKMLVTLGVERALDSIIQVLAT